MEYPTGETKREQNFMDSIRGLWYTQEEAYNALELYREFGSDRARAYALTCDSVEIIKMRKEEGTLKRKDLEKLVD